MKVKFFCTSSWLLPSFACFKVLPWRDALFLASQFRFKENLEQRWKNFGQAKAATGLRPAINRARKKSALENLLQRAFASQTAGESKIHEQRKFCKGVNARSSAHVCEFYTVQIFCRFESALVALKIACCVQLCCYGTGLSRRKRGGRWGMVLSLPPGNSKWTRPLLKEK